MWRQIDAIMNKLTTVTFPCPSISVPFRSVPFHSIRLCVYSPTILYVLFVLRGEKCDKIGELCFDEG